ncbi:uncharacterized protein LOC113160973 [Anabas testudineus]|uniref:uncharacterized protein LOC113160973 n=1 Tax=Anabas testudineus TaxID=64144 RepID=UPI000E465E6A|nr:uncharacterized protein LOC113160973 [Anabas testudineus]
MLAYQREESYKKEKRLLQLYEQWKIQARKAREQLKVDIPESQIADLIDTLEKAKNDIADIYMEVRDHVTPSGETRRRIDACEAVTRDIVNVAYERIAGIDGDFDSTTVKQRLRELLNRDYARSIYGSTASGSSIHSVTSIVATKVADTAAELAAKKVEYEMLMEEEKQRERIQQLEEQQKRDLAVQKHELEKFKFERDIRAAQAKLNVYNQEMKQDTDVGSVDYNTSRQQQTYPQATMFPAPVQQPINGPAPGHSARECRHRHTCDVCKGKHPTYLHDDNFNKGKATAASNQSSVSEGPTALSLSVKSEQPSFNTSMIVPVWLSSVSNPGVEQLVYALLDTQSDTVYIDQDVSHSIQTKSHPVRLKLATMTGKTTLVHSERIKGVKVRGYNSTLFIDLPPANTKDCIPVNRACIPTCETAKHWNHLNKIAEQIPPHLECEVGLLIGYNCSRALAPQQVIVGKDNEPYAVRTDLGWSIVGCTPSYHDTPNTNKMCHRVAVKELPPATPSDVIKVLESDFKDTCKDDRTVSQDDIVFLKMLKEGIQKNAQEHYEMPLPFKERPHLPDNKQLAVVRLGHLKRKLLRDDNYKEHYIKFVNEVIERGPDLTNSLAGVFIGFRTHHMALMYDVEQMFHELHVFKADRDYLRFLWWKDGDLKADPQQYRMKLEKIPLSEQVTEAKTLDLTFCDTRIERALGVLWHIESDTLRYHICLKNQPATRRTILSTVACLYDPLGFVAPFLLTGKRVLQEMCKNGTGWDDPLTSQLQPVWENWKSDIANLERIKIPRCYVPADFGHVVKKELHHFSDASTHGYGQCSYLRQVNQDGNVHCALITGKSRVAPLKVITIPRLELTAAVVSVAVSSILKEELGFSNMDEYFWTDSKVILGYIYNEARRFHTFVSNRIQRIHLTTTPQQWRYVSTDKNPADIASRGASVSELLSSDWFTGPQFLWEKEILSPKEVITEITIGDPEVRKVQSLNVQTTEQIGLSHCLLRFSSWYKVTQAIARLLRRIRGNKSTGHSTVQEREEAGCIIVRDVQKQVYSEEIKLLSKGSQIPSKSKLYPLEAFLDKDGTLRVGGRLKNACLPTSQKHPIVMPKDHHVTKMIITHYHEQVQHQGKGFTINEIRSNGYWVPGINKAVASHIYQCIKCRKIRRLTEEQRMADLPSERVEPSPPFTYCGMDCFGPFITKEGRKVHKRYGLLFTCLCCRAIHIEMLDDMSTDAFINGLRCFIALRGAVCKIRCDQGSNFVGAKNELKEALKQVDADRLTAFLAEKQCDFNLNAPQYSNVGGVRGKTNQDCEEHALLHTLTLTRQAR